MPHYNTDYSQNKTFEENCLTSDANLRQYFVPALLKVGFGMSPLAADTEPFLFSSIQKQSWIDTMSAKDGKIRPPDLRTLGNTFVKIQGTDCKSVDFEVKDFPQMNFRLNTGIPFHLLRRYIAWQHLTETPVVLLFRDTAKQEKGSGTLPAYSSCYKEADEYVPYGGLIFDLSVMPEYSYRQQKNGKIEVLWRAQRDREGGNPCMNSVSEIASLFASGKIKKIKGDPKNLPVWQLIQQKAEEGFGPKMIEPKDGLVYFITGG